MEFLDRIECNLDLKSTHIGQADVGEIPRFPIFARLHDLHHIIVADFIEGLAKVVEPLRIHVQIDVRPLADIPVKTDPMRRGR